MPSDSIDSAHDVAQRLFTQVVKELGVIRPPAEPPTGIIFFKNGVEQIYLNVSIGENSVVLNIGGEKGTIESAQPLTGPVAET